jgi:hypothetical protein
MTPLGDCAHCRLALPKKEIGMTQRIDNTRIRVGAFETMAEADQAIRRLLGTGFATDQFLVICPAKFQDHFTPALRAEGAPAAEQNPELRLGNYDTAGEHSIEQPDGKQGSNH